MKPSEIIKQTAIKSAKEDLGCDYGFMGKENAGHYVLGILKYLDEQYEAEKPEIIK